MITSPPIEDGMTADARWACLAEWAKKLPDDGRQRLPNASKSPCSTGAARSESQREAGAMLPETDLARIRRWVDARNAGLPERAVGLIRYEMDVSDRAVTILECRPPWREEYGPEWTRFPVARLRYTKVQRQWQIYWRDRNLKFHAYALASPTANVEQLLADIDADPTSIFWG